MGHRGPQGNQAINCLFSPLSTTPADPPLSTPTLFCPCIHTATYCLSMHPFMGPSILTPACFFGEFLVLNPCSPTPSQKIDQGEKNAQGAIIFEVHKEQAIFRGLAGNKKDLILLGPASLGAVVQTSQRIVSYVCMYR